MKVWNQLPSWVRDTLERAWWTFLAAFIAATGYQVGMSPEELAHVNWAGSAAIAAGATVFSMAKSALIAHTNLGDPGTASAVKLDTAPGRHARPDESA